MATEITASQSRSLAPSGGMGTALQQLKGITSQPAVVKSFPALAFLALAGVAALLWMTFTAAPSRDLFRGLPDEDKAAVTEALSGAGIAYDVDRNSGALTVSGDDYYQAKMLLAAQGLPKSAPDGAEMISSLPLGASRAVESERLRSARELDLARTIEAIDAVQKARVHLAVEQPSAFLRERTKPAASVLLTLAGGRTLGDQQVQAIVNLVASSVPGMTPDGVSVADQNGRLLSQQGNGGSSGEAERQVAIQAKIEQRYRESIETLLTPILGAGNFTAQVHADVDFSETQATREGFPKEASTLRAEEGAFTLANGADGAAGGIPGALSNQPPPAAQVATAPGGATAVPVPGSPESVAAAAAKRSENYSRNFAVGREVSVTRQQTGQVKRISVAVVLKNPEGGKPRSAQEIATFENLVKGAVGYDQTRGDVVALSSKSFVAVEAPVENWWEAGWVMLIVRNVTALAIAALVIFGFGRPLMKKLGSGLGKRAASPAVRAAVPGEIAAAIAHEARSSPDTRITLEMIETANSYETRAALIRNFVRQDPARAALVVRDLIRSDSKDGDKNG
jgi:flagellar M-ring protein FliF